MTIRAALFTSLLLPCIATADELAFFVGLGPDVQSIAALRADGLEIVGAQPNSEGYRWTLGAGLQTLECQFDAFGVEGCFEARPGGVSADGSIVVGTASLFFGADLDPLGWGAFRQVDGVQSPLGYLPGEWDSWATAISDDGSVIVGWSNNDYDYATAFRWTEAEGMTPLGALGTDSQVVPKDVSADGSVIVGSSAPCCYYGQEAFRWSADDGMVGLGILGPTGESSANGVSADGLVIVGGATPAGGNAFNGDTVAFRWDHSGAMELLGDLPGVLQSSASAASYDGSVIVGGGTTAAGSEALIWTRQSGFRRLRTLLGSVPGLDLGEWKLTGAVDVSVDGRTIVGNGINPDGVQEAWLVFLPAPEPTPSAAVFAALASVAFLAGVRRQRPS